MNQSAFVSSLSFIGSLTGPIFGKELRVASRRKRYYWLRGLFVLLLLVLIVWTWTGAMAFSHSGSSAFVAMRMSMVSRSVVSVVVWLEFILMPLLAAVMLSGSISQEVNKRTLDVLLTTPITSLQLVMGKLLSCLLQMILLMGLTLPLFAIVRVFGGVPWDFVVVSLCMTLTTTFLFGVLSLLYSIWIRQPYRVVFWVVFTAMFVFGLVPGGLAILMQEFNWGWVPPTLDTMSVINPFIGMAEMTESVSRSHSVGVGIFPWGLHCLIILGVSLGLLFLSIWRVRAKMVGSLDVPSQTSRWGVIGRLLGRGKSDRVERREMIALRGDPIIWKEMRRSDGRGVLGPRFGLIVMISLIAVTYIIASYFGWLVESGFHAAVVTILAALGLFQFGVLSALSISGEKQAKTWPILLTTPIENGDIIKLKSVAIFKKTLIYWVLIVLDVVIFSACRVVNPFAIIGVLVAIIPSMFYLLGAGMYFGMRFKTTMGAMTATIGFPIGLSLLCPCFAYFSPLSMIAISVAVKLEDIDMHGVLMGGGISLIPAVIYSVAGWLFLVRASYSMRNYLFNTSD